MKRLCGDAGGFHAAFTPARLQGLDALAAANQK